jgi:ferredoxin
VNGFIKVIIYLTIYLPFGRSRLESVLESFNGDEDEILSVCEAGCCCCDVEVGGGDGSLEYAC